MKEKNNNKKERILHSTTEWTGETSIWLEFEQIEEC